MTIWFNGELTEKGNLDASSAGATLGWGVFTTVGIRNGMPQFLPRHIERLQRDAQVADVPLGYSHDEIETGLHTVLKANSVQNGLARLTATRRDDGRWNGDEGADLSILAHSAAASPADLRVQLSPYRTEPKRPLAGVKTTSYLAYLWAWREAKSNGFDEAILRDGSDFLCEAARSNLFWLTDDEIFTPSLETGCLRGLGRELVLEWAEFNGVPVREGQFPSLDALLAEQTYLVSAATGPRHITAWHDEKGEPLRRWASGSDLIRELREWWDRAGVS